MYYNEVPLHNYDARAIHVCQTTRFYENSVYFYLSTNPCHLVFYRYQLRVSRAWQEILSFPRPSTCVTHHPLQSETAPEGGEVNLSMMAAIKLTWGLKVAPLFHLIINFPLIIYGALNSPIRIFPTPPEGSLTCG